MAGRKLFWKVTIHGVYEFVEALDQDVFDTADVENYDQLKDKFRAEARTHHEEQVHESKLSQVMMELRRKTEFDPIPDSMVEAMVDREIQAFKMRNRGVKWPEDQEQRIRDVKFKECYTLAQQKVAARSFAARYGLEVSLEDIASNVREFQEKGSYTKAQADKAIEDSELDDKIRKNLEETVLPRKVSKFIWSEFENRDLWKKDTPPLAEPTESQAGPASTA